MEKNTTIKLGDAIIWKGNVCNVIEIHSTYACIQKQQEDQYLKIKPKYIIPLFERHLKPIDYSLEIIHV